MGAAAGAAPPATAGVVPVGGVTATVGGPGQPGVPIGGGLAGLVPRLDNLQEEKCLKM